MQHVPPYHSTTAYLEALRQCFQRDTEQRLAAARAEQVAADAEAEAASARDDAAVETDLC